jgi:hypothetical protein
MTELRVRLDDGLQRELGQNYFGAHNDRRYPNPQKDYSLKVDTPPPAYDRTDTLHNETRPVGHGFGPLSAWAHWRSNLEAYQKPSSIASNHTQRKYRKGDRHWPIAVIEKIPRVFPVMEVCIEKIGLHE